MKLTGSAKRMLAGVIFVLASLVLIWHGWRSSGVGNEIVMWMAISALVGYIFGAVSFWGHGRPAAHPVPLAPVAPPRTGQN